MILIMTHPEKFLILTEEKRSFPCPVQSVQESVTVGLCGPTNAVH